MTNGTSAMLGCRSGFQALVKAANHNTSKLHCMIHRYALATKTLHIMLKTAPDVVTMVIESTVLNTRMFHLLCRDFNAEEESLLFHMEARRLPRGNVIARAMALKVELK